MEGRRRKGTGGDRAQTSGPRKECLSGASGKKGQAQLCRKILILQDWIKRSSEPRLGWGQVC